MCDSNMIWYSRGSLNIDIERSRRQDCGIWLYRIIVVLLNQDKLNLCPPGSH